MKVKIFHLHLVLFLVFIYNDLSDHELFSLLCCYQCSILWHGVQQASLQDVRSEKNVLMLPASSWIHVGWSLMEGKNPIEDVHGFAHSHLRASDKLLSAWNSLLLLLLIWFSHLFLATYHSSFMFQMKWFFLRRALYSTSTFYLS